MDPGWVCGLFSIAQYSVNYLIMSHYCEVWVFMLETKPSDIPIDVPEFKFYDLICI